MREREGEEVMSSSSGDETDDSALRELEEEEAAAAAVAAAEKAVTGGAKVDSERRSALAKLEETEEKLLEAFGCCKTALEEIRAAAVWSDDQSEAGGCAKDVSCAAAALHIKRVDHGDEFVSCTIIVGEIGNEVQKSACRRDARQRGRGALEWEKARDAHGCSRERHTNTTMVRGGDGEYSVQEM